MHTQIVKSKLNYILFAGFSRITNLIGYYELQVFPESQNYVVLVTHICHAHRVKVKHNLHSLLYEEMWNMFSWSPVGDGTYVSRSVPVEYGYVRIYLEPSLAVQRDSTAVFGGFVFGISPQKAYASALGLHPSQSKASLKLTSRSYSDPSDSKARLELMGIFISSPGDHIMTTLNVMLV